MCGSPKGGSFVVSYVAIVGSQGIPMARSETLAHLLPLASRLYGGKPALVCADKNITFCQLNQLALRFARALVTLGVRPGDRVTLYCHNCLEWLIRENAGNQTQKM